jgi:hypothetical protein
MANLRTVLLSLIPIVGDHPPPIFLATPFAAAVSDDGADTQFQHAALREAQAQQFMLPVQVHHRPEIGGERITEEWLRSQKETDILWRFRHVMMSCNFFVSA